MTRNARSCVVDVRGNGRSARPTGTVPSLRAPENRCVSCYAPKCAVLRQIWTTVAGGLVVIDRSTNTTSAGRSSSSAEDPIII